MSNRRKQVRATTELAQLAMLAPVAIAQRTAKMAQRGTNANAREGRRMITEKISASSESLPCRDSCGTHAGAVLLAVAAHMVHADGEQRGVIDAGIGP